MSKFPSFIFLALIFPAIAFLNSCTQKGCSGDSCPDKAGATANINNGGENPPNPNPPQPNPPQPVTPTLAPAVDPNYKFKDLNDYCSTLNTYAQEGTTAPGDKILGCWVLKSLIPKSGAPAQFSVCNYKDINGAPFSTCGIYIFDHYRKNKSVGCGSIASVDNYSKKSFKVFGSLDFKNIYASWAGSDNLFKDLPNLDGFSYSTSENLITKTIISEDSNLDGGGVLFKGEVLKFERLNPIPGSMDFSTTQFMKSSGCTIPTN